MDAHITFSNKYRRKGCAFRRVQVTWQCLVWKCGDLVGRRALLAARPPIIWRWPHGLDSALRTNTRGFSLPEGGPGTYTPPGTVWPPALCTAAKAIANHEHRHTHVTILTFFSFLAYLVVGSKTGLSQNREHFLFLLTGESTMNAPIKTIPLPPEPSLGSLHFCVILSAPGSLCSGTCFGICSLGDYPEIQESWSVQLHQRAIRLWVPFRTFRMSTSCWALFGMFKPASFT